jgi:hypothetical protein
VRTLQLLAQLVLQGRCGHLVMLMPAPLQLCKGRCRYLVVLLPAPLHLC